MSLDPRTSSQPDDFAHVDKSCHACHYADPTVLHNVDGDGPAAVLLCRRYPPVPVYEADTEGTAPSWPLVHEQEWCGEWKEQP